MSRCVGRFLKADILSDHAVIMVAPGDPEHVLVRRDVD